MTWPPAFLRLRVRSPQRHFGLWLPLFPIWPLALVLALALSPFIVVLALFMWPWGGGKKLLLSGPTLFRLVCSLRGFHIDVQTHSEQVFVSFT